jgi:hypothetical protein
MTREELAKELERLGDINAEINPVAASILFTLSGLIITETEMLLAIETHKINDEFIKQLKNLTNNEN